MTAPAQPAPHGFRIILGIAATETLAAILVGRGVYFFAHDRMHVSDQWNLIMGMVGGVCYVAGALPSHRIAQRLGERTTVIVSVLVQMAAYGSMFLFPNLAVVFIGKCVGDWANGLKWPVIESYVSAGRTPIETAASLGKYNLVWSAFTPLGILWAGPLIARTGHGIFAAATLCSLPTLLLTCGLLARPEHLAHDHPDRPATDDLPGLKSLLVSSRWSLITSYLLLQALVPLLPGILSGLGFGVTASTSLASALDVGRFVGFLFMERTHKWHGRRDILALVALVMPVAFFVCLWGNSATTVVGGELVLGIFEGVAYGAALYYAMVVSNSSVDAGGKHEALIGAGIATGPALGLVGKELAAVTGNAAVGMALGIGPIAAVAMGLSLRPLLLLKRRTAP